MLYWAAVFLLISITAAIFGFTGIAVGAASIAQLLFYLFLILFVASIIVHGVRSAAKGRPPI